MDFVVRVKGHTLYWPADVQEALMQIHQVRGATESLPARVWAEAERKQGRILLWPAMALDLDAYPLHVSPAGRQVTLRVPDLLEELGVRLPPGVVVAVPLNWLQDTPHGQVLALPFREGTFLYRNSRLSAIGRFLD